MNKYDLIVLGGGAGGLTAAAGAAGMGAKVALIEREEHPGGDCLHYGCVPSKAFKSAAKQVHIAKQAAQEFGLTGFGRFKDDHHIEIMEGETVYGKRIVISTGSGPVIPPIEGLKEAGYLTNETVFDLRQRPERLIVVGAGPTGLELAQSFARFCTRVTVVEFAAELFGREDAEMVPYVQTALEKEMTILLNTKIRKAERLGNGKKLMIVLEGDREESLIADEILVAAGRKPNTLGDVLRAFPFTHAAGMEGKSLLCRKKRTGAIFVLAICIALAGCTADKDTAGDRSKSKLLGGNWDYILEQAKGQTVNMYMWGGSDSINTYIDEWAAPRLKQEAGVALNRVPMNDTKDIINKLLAEKQTSRKSGSIDIMWINGENFRTSKDSELLWGSFASKLPNAQKYADLDSADIANDFGVPTEGMEAPWGKAQFVFIYDSEKVKSPPKSMEQFKKWVRENRGKFTYPAPPDFTGSAFVRHAMYEITGGYEQYLEPLESKDFETKLGPVWDYLNEIEPYLWREGTTYPESLAKLDQLFANGEVWMSMGYDPSRASNLIAKGTYPQTARTFVLDGGTLSNTHYLAIPFNAPSPAGAMAAINFLLSPDAQITKYDPLHWGEDMAIDPDKLSDDEKKRLAAIDRGPATLPPDVLSSHQLPEIPSALVGVLEKSWNENVAKK